MACGSCEYIKWKFDLERYSCAYRYMTAQQQGGVWVDVEVQPPANMPTNELPHATARDSIAFYLRQTYGLVDGPTSCGPGGRCRCIRTSKYVVELAMRVDTALPRPLPIPPLGQQFWWECDLSFVVVIRKWVAKGQCFPVGLAAEQINPPDDD